jgi:hypothetical protein
MHEIGFAHMDVKPENICFHGDRFLLIDRALWGRLEFYRGIRASRPWLASCIGMVRFLDAHHDGG